MVTTAAKWTPGLSSGYKASRRKRCEDDINQFLKPEETEETKGNDLKNNDTWIRVAKDQIRWKEMENITHGTSQKDVSPASNDISSSPSVYKMTITIATSDGIGFERRQTKRREKL